MKKMSTSELTARINRFMDRKMASMTDVSELADFKARRSPRKLADVSDDSPYIMLAVR